MSKALRLSEKWFRRGLWLVAFVFAGFLIGLGGTVVDDLPKVEKPLRIEDFLDRPAADRLRATITQSEATAREARDALEQARLRRRVAEADTRTTRESFQNWLSTRRATQLADQDPEVIARTQALDRLKAAERVAEAAVQRQEQAATLEQTVAVFQLDQQAPARATVATSRPAARPVGQLAWQ
jgi:hypothetical protein